MSTSLIILICWGLATCVIFYRARHSFLYFIHRAVDKVTLLSKEEYKRRWDGPYPRPVSIPQPFLRPALRKALKKVKETDAAFAAVATAMLSNQRERELTETEKTADLALFHADPHLAIELGYKAPNHECQWSRTYWPHGEAPGPFTCGICGRRWVS